MSSAAEALAPPEQARSSETVIWHAVDALIDRSPGLHDLRAHGLHLQRSGRGSTTTSYATIPSSFAGRHARPCGASSGAAAGLTRALVGAGRIADYDRTGLDIVGDDRSGTDQGPVADRDPSEDDRAGAE
jgi:hypothetical protein